ncbi:MAG TPA: protein phosphatase 2C domain-containing protein [Solirubrobacteraceae bacterium]|nr:protein phosphatase 2C domain-containing protein [Solirubrobacteraceae bacterium]
MSALMLEAAARTETGPVRGNNEDAVFAGPRLLAVADGVGGAAAGEVASRLAIDAVAHLAGRRLDAPLEGALADALATANDTIGFVAECRPLMAGMSTTLTTVALSDDGAYLLANVGDSRTYLLRDGALTRLSRDDSLVQLLVDRGAVTPAEARRHPQRSLVLETLDGRPRERTAPARLRARAGDRLLLCSDGLSDMVDDDAIATALREPSREACADRLVGLALAAGGRDNVSVVVADVVERRDPAAAWAPPAG